MLRAKRVDMQQRIRILNRVYHETPTNHYIQHCGIFEGEPEKVVQMHKSGLFEEEEATPDQMRAVDAFLLYEGQRLGPE